MAAVGSLPTIGESVKKLFVPLSESKEGGDRMYMTFEQVCLLIQLMIAVVGLNIAGLTLILNIVLALLTMFLNHQNKKK